MDRLFGDGAIEGRDLRVMETFPRWIFILLVVIALARIAALLARRFDLPSISLQLLIGILLGPSAFNILGTPVVLGTWGSPSSGLLHGSFKILAEIGLIQLMFLAGLETNWRELRKVIRISFSIGVWEFGLTAAGVAILTRLFVDRWSEALAMSAIVSASSFGISIYYFSEMKVLGSRVAAMVLGAAILSGLLAILLMIASQATNYAAVHGTFRMIIAVSWFLGKLVMFFAIAYFLTSRFLKLASKSGFSKRPRQMLIGYLLLVAALYAWAAMHFGSFAAVGVASLGGGILGASNPEVKEKIDRVFESILSSIPVGILLMVIGMEVNLKVVESSILFLGFLLIIVIGTKLIGCWIATKGYPSSSERVFIMLGVLAQGEMGVLIAAYLFSRGVLNPQFFGMAILVVAGLTTVSPILMRIVSSESDSKELNGAPGLKNSSFS
ncbi:MAG TPA: cation:proton antiporter [Thermodesulfobacteriota bacterium]|nr:cation:proton antiporter [Thermodesulfobacteriota bacterium]